MQRERDGFGGVELEGVVCSVKLERRAEAQVQAVGIGMQLPVLDDHGDRPAGVVRRGIEDVMHRHLAGEALDEADDARVVVRLGMLDDAALIDRHEVGDDDDPGARGEDGVEEVRPVAVDLMHLVPLVGVDLPAPALLGVEDPAEE